MTFDYSRLTGQDFFEFALMCLNKPWGPMAGVLTLIARTGVDLTAIPVTDVDAMIKEFWANFPSAHGLEGLFKGEKDASRS